MLLHLQLYGWKWGMFAPGIVGLVMGLVILLGVSLAHRLAHSCARPLGMFGMPADPAERCIQNKLS